MKVAQPGAAAGTRGNGSVRGPKTGRAVEKREAAGADNLAEGDELRCDVVDQPRDGLGQIQLGRGGGFRG